MMNRRDFVKAAGTALAATLVGDRRLQATPPDPLYSRLPRWRGFNLIDLLSPAAPDSRVQEEDFAWMAEWGFNFVRLPLSYLLWSDRKDWRQLREPGLRAVDEALCYADRYRIHLCLCLHRAPGYSVDRSDPEALDLWSDPEALDACAWHWRHLAQRYKDAPNSRISFNLINEPAVTADGRPVDDAMYAHVAQVLSAAIRTESPDRLMIADGLAWARLPVPRLTTLRLAQSVHVYDPMRVTHWQADWVEGSADWPAPEWPPAPGAMPDRNLVDFIGGRFPDNPIAAQLAADPVLVGDWNRARIEHQLVQPWRKIQALGAGVHVGEFGVHHRTPHVVALAWMKDMLDAWRANGWGWALWNLRGSFGVLDSERTDVTYEAFHGRRLDRRMLELLRAS